MLLSGGIAVNTDAENSSKTSRSQESTRAPAETEWQRRKRLAAVFGDVLPETTGDERAGGRAGDEGRSDDWYLAQRPPHHGG